jgi:ABC-2 type transport system permease protein
MKEKIQQLSAKYRYSVVLLRQLVITDFKLRYKGSALGYLWSLLRPLALFAVLYIVFVQFLRFGADVPHFAVSLLLGIVLWNYFVEVTSNGLSAIVNRGDLMRKLSFPRYTIVVAGSLSAFINLSINLVVVGVFIVLNGVDLSWSTFLIIPLIIELFVFALSIAFLLGALFVRFRDVNYIWELLLQAGFYATPIIYPLSLVIEKSPEFARLLILGPVAQIIQDARAAVIWPQGETIISLFHNPFLYIVPLGIVAVVSVVGVLYFKKRSPSFAEEI